MWCRARYGHFRPAQSFDNPVALLRGLAAASKNIQSREIEIDLWEVSPDILSDAFDDFDAHEAPRLADAMAHVTSISLRARDKHGRLSMGLQDEGLKIGARWQTLGCSAQRLERLCFHDGMDEPFRAVVSSVFQTQHTWLDVNVLVAT